MSKGKKRFFGGYLSLRQVLYIMLAGASLTIFIPPIPIVIKILLVSIIVPFLLLCAFLKISEQNFDKFFFYALKYIFRKRKFTYERCCK